VPMNRLFVLVPVLALYAVPSPARAEAAEDWPKWLGPRGDNISQEKIADQWPKDGPKQLWQAPVGEGHASPVAKAGKVYLFTLQGGQEFLTCFDANTGEVAWKEGHRIEKQADYPGTRATPAIDGERVYTLGEAGDLTCRELADGKEVWRTNVLKETGAKMLGWGCASSPLIVGERIFVQTGEGGPIAVAVDKADGKVLWRSEGTSKAGFASLVYADIKGKPQVIIFAGKGVGGLDPETGKTIWADDFQTRYDVNAATPVYHDGRVLFTAEYDTGRAAMYAVSNKQWKKVWQNKRLKSKFQPVILDDGFVYGNDGGTPVCVRWDDGKEAWRADGNDMKLGSGGSMVRVGDDKLITMSEKGRLSLVKANPQGYKLLGQVELFDADQIWASPLVYDGKLYCKGRDEFVCLDVSGK
jgi:outer membrane protein assembly factor BamB